MKTEEIISNVSRPVYLHFLNREFLSQFINYFSISTNIPTIILQDVRLSLFCSYEYSYLSPSLIFEDRFARLLIHELPLLFQMGHIRLTLPSQSISTFIDSKKEQYSHAKGGYGFYFDDTWKQIEDVGLTYKTKSFDTSSNLENKLTGEFNNKSKEELLSHLKIDQYESIIAEVRPYAIEAIETRGNLAITGLLFSRIFAKFDLKLNLQKFFTLKIVEQYIKDYLSEFNGTLPTGLLSGNNLFDYLSPTFPFHHLEIWEQIYFRLGCISSIRKFSDAQIVEVREEVLYQNFINTVRIVINILIKETESYSATQQIAKITQRITTSLLYFQGTKSVNVDGFLYNLEKATECLNSRDFKLSRTSINKPILMKSHNVFVIYGRNEEMRKSLFSFLRAAGLKPLEWEQAVSLSGSGSPYIGDVIDKAFENAQAVIALLTGDDLAVLSPDLQKPSNSEQQEPQPRLNVIFETGMALGKQPERTIIVQVGRIREISDLSGRHIIKLDNTVSKRKALLIRLKDAGCSVDMDGSDWMDVDIFGFLEKLT
jgi:predicted nucleotide-binding protein